MVIRGEATKEKLDHIYKTIQKYIKEKECYYTEEEIEKLKEDKNNTFYKIE